MPLASSISAGNIIHKPYVGRVEYIGTVYVAAPEAPDTGVTSLSQSINIPTNLGPDKIMWIGLVTTRNNVAQNISSVRLNDRDMELLADVGSQPISPVQWYGIRLRNNETNPAVFTVTEGADSLRSMLVTIYIGRGMVSSYDGALAYSSAAVVVPAGFPGWNGTSFYQQQPAPGPISHPPGIRSTVLYTTTKELITGGDSTSSGFPVNFPGQRIIRVSTAYFMPSNMFRVNHVSYTIDPGTSGPSNPTYSYTSNTNTIAQAAAIVVY